MDILYSTELAIPIYQVGLLMIFSTLGLLFGRIKLALLINFIFVLYWGYWLNRESVIGTGIPEMAFQTETPKKGNQTNRPQEETSIKRPKPA